MGYKRTAKPVILSLFLAIFAASTAMAAPAAELWERWTAHDAGSQVRVDHSAWDQFLRRYVVRSADGRSVVRYGAVTAADREDLGSYVGRLASIEVGKLRRREQKAYWINLYNALTVQLVLMHYPVDTIKEIGGNFLFPGPWRDDLVEIEGIEVSLDDIEHRILRPIWQDPRIHYAVNCAAMSCPDLQEQAFTAENTDRLLTKGAKDFVNHPRGLRVEGQDLTISSIYKWYGEDFGATDADLIDHLKQFATQELREKIATTTSVTYQSYDWSLNDAGR